MKFGTKLLRLVLVVLLGEIFVAPSSFAQSYSFQPLTQSADGYAVGYGINSVGEIVGTAVSSQSDTVNTFVLNKGSFQTLVFPSAFAYAQTGGINRSQTVVGWWEGSGGDPNSMFHSFVAIQQGKKPRSFATFDFPGASATMANGVNDTSQVVGSFTDNVGVVHGFTYKAPNFASIDYPQGVATVANAISDRGEIIGYYEDSSGGLHGFASVKGKMTPIDFPTSVGLTEATAVNTAGTVVGIYGQFNGGVPAAHGFVFNKGIYSTLDYPNAMGTYLVGINTAGNILGYYYGASCNPPPADEAAHPCGFVATPSK